MRHEIFRKREELLIQMNCLERSSADAISIPQSAQVLRKWCTPETILVITNLSDEDALLFHVVRQARQGETKVILIQAAQLYSSPSSARTYSSSRTDVSLSFRFAQLVLARMARKLRWVGLECEPILNRAFLLPEIHSLVKLSGVDRVIISAKAVQYGQDVTWKVFTDDLVQGIQVPVCVIGSKAASDFGIEQHSGRVSLALSLNADSELALAFASRFAQEHHLRLTVMHVVSTKAEETKRQYLSPAGVASRLSAPTLREAERFCPLEICVREGDPASELLKYDAETNQDYMILRSTGSALRSEPEESITHRIVQEARCPVIILGGSPAGIRGEIAAKSKTQAVVGSVPFGYQSEHAEECA